MIVTNVEYPRDKNGNPYKRVFVGQQKANVFPKDPLYNLCNPGADIDAHFVPDGKFWKLERSDMGVTVPKPQAPNVYDEAREKKEDGIHIAQMRKDEAMRMAATFRDASLLTVAMMNQETEVPWDRDKVAMEWKYWRTWLEEHYEPSLTDGIPF